MDLKEYKKAKQHDGISIARVDEKTARVFMKQFDNVTGQEVAAVHSDFNLDELEAQKAVAQAHLDGINDFIADLKAIEVIALAKPKKE